MNQFRLTLGFLTIFISCPPVFAHPGHGTEVTTNSNGVLHYLTEPIHAIPLAAVVLFPVLFFIGKKIWQRLLDQRQEVTVRHKRQK